MGMTPTVYFKTFVEPNCDDCADEPGCVRRAFNAAVSAAHLADQFYKYAARHDPSKIAGFGEAKEFLEHVSVETNGAFRDIRNISNAYKHLYVDIDPRNPVQLDVASTGAISSVEFSWPESEVNSISEELGPAAQSTKVVFQRRDGSTEDFLPRLEAVRAFWEERLRDGE
jgi:hypothetical protein